MSEKVKFKNAFKCNKCPMSNDENGCPMWWEMVMTNEDNQTKVEKGCGYQMMPQLLVEVIKTADHTTAAAYDMRNKVVESVANVLNKNPLTIKENEVKQIDK